MLRLYLDEDSMESALIHGLRGLGFDVVTVDEADNRALPDESQLEFAAEQGQAIYSQKRGPFLRAPSSLVVNREESRWDNPRHGTAGDYPQATRCSGGTRR